MLPAMKKWPFRGFTFCTWIRIESFEDPTGLGGNTYNPRLYSFLSDDGFGLESMFVEQRLTLRTIVRGRPGNGNLSIYKQIGFPHSVVLFKIVCQSNKL